MYIHIFTCDFSSNGGSSMFYSSFIDWQMKKSWSVILTDPPESYKAITLVAPVTILFQELI